jgi:PAS domain S-box-containing protein
MSKANVVVVEDESIVALDIKNRLVSLGYSVTGMATTGTAALKAVFEQQPDIVLMDIKLKGDMDGIETANQIRAKFDIPVVYLTAFADDATLERAKLSESFGYLLKPFEERELSATVETALYKHQIERQLKSNRHWLHTTLNSIGDAVITTDLAGRINFMNPVAEALTGWTRDEAQSKPAQDVLVLVDDLTGEIAEDLMAQVLQSGQSIKLESTLRLISRDQTTVYIDANVTPIKDGGHEISGAVLVLKDVSDQRRTAVQLQEFAEQLQAHNEELDAFAHTVAHDLQNPLGNLVGMADALRTYHSSMEPEELHDYLSSIVQNGLKMSSIIDSLLLLAGVRRREAVPVSPLNMKQIVSEAEQRLASMINEHNARIHQPEEWPIVLGYGPWIEEVWANYLSNAIKYGGRPPIIELGADKLDDGTVCFWTQDNGIGLPAEQQEQLFVPFTQLSQVKIQGMGLGLSIVRRIIEKLYGAVGVTSEGIGQGSRFYFILPVADDFHTATDNV